MHIPSDELDPSRQVRRADAERWSAWIPWVFLGYLVFVLYGSLIPFEIRPITLDQAWYRFLHIRFLNLGVVSRADWVANIALYIPLAFLGAAWAHQSLPAGRVSIPRLIAVLVGCGAIAVGVEFLQVFVKPRTVSINDLIAEGIGIGTGLVLWVLGRGTLLRKRFELGVGGHRAVVAALSVYALVYVALSLFPYDLLVSAEELRWKIAGQRHGWLFAPAACMDTMRCLAKLAAEVIAVMPLGALVAMRRESPSWRQAALVGGLLGVALEVVQLLMATGVSQGVSILTRSLGTALGARTAVWLSGGGLARTSIGATRLVVAAIVPYLLMLLELNGWFNNSWVGWQDAVAKLKWQMFLPFYYHYFSSEAGAMESVLAAVAMYAPIGLGYWVWTQGRRAVGSTTTATVFGGLVAFAIEAGKLFLAGKHPDPTTVLIAMLSAGLTYRLAWWASRQSIRGGAVAALAPDSASRVRTQGFIGMAGQPCLICALLPLTAVAWIVAHRPVGALWLAVLLAVYAIVLWQRPNLWLLFVPALLPVLDLTPWTGRFYLDELDFLLGVTVIVLYARTRTQLYPPPMPKAARLVIALLTVSYTASLAIGLLPLQPLDANAFSNYYSHYNSLRVAKGFFWALALLPLIRRSQSDSEAAKRYLLTGMLVGVLATAVSVAWQRHLFGGLLNFSDNFRVTGAFSSMHVGGGAIGGYLAAALPFAVVWAATRRSPGQLGLGLVLLVAGTYALLVTFARAAYLGFAVGLIALAVGWWLRPVASASQSRMRRVLFPATVGVVLLGVSVPVLQGSFAESRFSNTASDLSRRITHWSEVMKMTESGWFSAVFGAGLGRFPETYLWRTTREPLPATYQFAREGDNIVLKLGSGDPLYFGQRIDLLPDRTYTLSLRLRGTVEGSVLSVPVCEKALLYSFRCKWPRFRLDRANGRWELHQREFASDGLGGGPWYARRPVELALYNGVPGTVLEVVDVRLADAAGNNLIRNGDFESAMDHWLFAVDNHWPWHIENIWLALYFEQGGLGVVAFCWLVVFGVVVVVRRVRYGDELAVAVLGTIAAFLTVGLFSSLLDFPRLTTFFYLLLFIAFSRAALTTGR